MSFDVKVEVSKTKIYQNLRWNIFQKICNFILIRFLLYVIHITKISKESISVVIKNSNTLVNICCFIFFSIVYILGLPSICHNFLCMNFSYFCVHKVLWRSRLFLQPKNWQRKRKLKYLFSGRKSTIDDNIYLLQLLM